MLLAVEERGGTAGAMKNFLGGKRDYWTETPRAVAARECWEETGRLLSSVARAAIGSGARPVAWAPRSKFALFLHELGPEDTDLTAARGAARVRRAPGGGDPAGSTDAAGEPTWGAFHPPPLGRLHYRDGPSPGASGCVGESRESPRR